MCECRCLLAVLCCVLFVVGCVLSVFVVGCVRCVARCVVCVVVRCMCLCVVRCALFVVRCLLFIDGVCGCLMFIVLFVGGHCLLYLVCWEVSVLCCSLFVVGGWLSWWVVVG